MRTVRFSLILAVLGAMLSFGGPAQAATITVDENEDELNTDGDCSLREAIEAANTNAGVDACPAGSGTETDTIVIPADTFTLSIPNGGEDLNQTGDLDITDDVTIDGAGARSTFIDGADLDRVFDVAPGGETIGVLLSGLTIRNGSHPTECGGGVRNGATLEILRVSVTDNEASCAGGIANSAGTTSDVTLTVRESLVARNVALDDVGGGIINEGSGSFSATSTIENVTISGNRAAQNGGGFWNQITGSTSTLNNVTIADNTADSDGNDDGDGGGVQITGGTVTISNTIVGDNNDASTGGGTRHDDCSGTLQSNSYDLIENTTGCTITGSQTGNITGQDPQLQALADEGGPTDTHQLKNNSPAVDTANPAAPDGTPPKCETVDQRGFNRPRGPRCDIGAFERGAGEQIRCLNKKVTLEGTTGPDTLTGTSKRDVIAAGEGDDVVTTQGGNDFVCAGAGNERIRTGRGTDQVIGEPGKDRVRSGPAADTVRGNGGRDRLIGGGGPDLLKGGRARDRLIGGGGDDTCKGGPGKDKIRRC
ncbi:MAG: choice-of-anchor Q domain-containing protein [Actinomycetota bacterium]